MANSIWDKDWRTSRRGSTNNQKNTLPPSIVLSSNPVYQQIWRDTASNVMTPIITRIAIDVANVPIRHVRIDKVGDYVEDIKSKLNDRLNFRANIDQTGFAFCQDIATNLLENGVVAIVPTMALSDDEMTFAYEIESMRTGIVEDWYNLAVRLSVYNENTGKRDSVIQRKSYVALIYNPLYGIMNEPNSTLKTLIEKRALLDLLDNKVGSSKLDLILQLPYAVKLDKQKLMAEERLRAIEEQLENSRYGIAYVDGTERITQLNRSVENNLPEQVLELTTSLYNQLGLTEKVVNGTATSDELIAYYNRTIEPIIKAIVSSLKMAFLTQTARTQGHDIMAFPNLFKMAPLEKLASAADLFTRNEIMTSNEVRSRLGLVQVKAPGADELRNKNLNKENQDPNANQSKNKQEVTKNG